jgi:hypothetical protein
MLRHVARKPVLLMVWSCLLLASPVAAQSPPQVAPSRQAWADGLKIWVTTTDGSEQKGTLVSFSPAGLVLQTASGRTSIPFRDLRAIETPDSLRNGMRNGAIAGSVLFGLPALAVVLSEPCRQG